MSVDPLDDGGSHTHKPLQAPQEGRTIRLSVLALILPRQPLQQILSFHIDLQMPAWH